MINVRPKSDAEFSIKDYLHRSLPRSEEGRPYKKIHASGMTKEGQEFCPREVALASSTGTIPRKQFLGTATLHTFAMGWEIQSRLNNDWLRDVMWGNWRCPNCGDIKQYCRAPTGMCMECGSDARWIYEEVVASPTDRPSIVGSIDGFIDMGEGKLRMVEMKTMDKDKFKELKAPLAEHRIRTLLYLKLLELSGLPEKAGVEIDVEKAFVFYVTKSFGFKDESIKAKGIVDQQFSPFKEFTVTRNDEEIDHIYNAAKPADEYLSGSTKRLPCGVCVNGLDKRANVCPVAKKCFSGSYHGETTWLVKGLPKHPDRIVID